MSRGPEPAELWTILDALPEMVAYWDRALICRFANRAYQAWMGLPAERIVGASMAELLGDRVMAFNRPLVEAALRGEPQTFDGAVPEGIRGVGRFVQVRYIPDVVDGAARGFTLQALDVTGRREAELALREREAQVLQLQKLDSLGRLAGGIAHDFNNMLMGILCNVEFARESLGGASPAVTEALTDAIECARRSAELTGQILAFARQQPIRPRLLDLGALVAEALPMLRRLLGGSIELVWTPCDGPTPVLLDPAQVHPILANLVLNARDAIVGGGRIEVATARARFDSTYRADHPDAQVGPHVGLVVRDTGSGMPPDVAARAFEPFFTTKSGGAGLGLSIVHGVVAQNGGHVVLDSRPGAGTTLSLWFPRAGDELRSDDRDARPDKPPRGTETVLVVEDEPTVQRLLVTSLRRLGYTVLAASAPDEALAIHAAHADAIDLVVSDMVMPIMSGLDLVRALRARRPGLPCVVVSGHGLDLPGGFGDLGDARVLPKPFRMYDLAVALREALAAAR